MSSAKYTNFIVTFLPCFTEIVNFSTKSVFSCLKTEYTDFKGIYNKIAIKVAIYLESVKKLALLNDDSKKTH